MNEGKIKAAWTAKLVLDAFMRFAPPLCTAGIIIISGTVFAKNMSEVMELVESGAVPEPLFLLVLSGMLLVFFGARASSRRRERDLIKGLARVPPRSARSSLITPMSMAV